MATSWSSTAGNAALTSLLGSYTWIQLHTASPGSAGTSNVASNSTRKQATWGSASGGSASNSADITWTSVSASEDYTHFTCWTASTAGTFGFSGTITANAVSSGDDFVIPTGDLTVSLTLAS